MPTRPAYQDKYNKILKETFKYVSGFLDSHNLRWFVCGGTCIGAIRHKGFIPWDDDVDICMPKEDFDKLCSIKEELLKDHYKLLLLSDKGYYCAHGKIIDTNTTLWEKEYYPFISGVFVDIFPLYTTDLPRNEIIKSMGQYKSLFLSYNRTITRISFKSFINSLFVTHTRVWREYIINKILYPHYKRSYYLRQLAECERHLYKKNGQTALCYTAFKYGEKEIMKASCFSDYIEMPFEDFSVRVPIGYHEYLSSLYGDYMEFPPEEKRVVEHGDMRHYINLNEGLSLSEVKNRINKGEKEVY